MHLLHNSLAAPSKAGYIFTTPLRPVARASNLVRRQGSQGVAIAQLDGLLKHLAVGPAPSDSTPDGRPLAAKLTCLDFPNDMLGVDAHCRVSVAWSKPYESPHDTTDLPDTFPLDGRNTPTTTTPPNPPPPRHRRRRISVERMQIDKLSTHPSVRGRGGVIVFIYGVY